MSFDEGIPGNSRSGIPVWKRNGVRRHTPLMKVDIGLRQHSRMRETGHSKRRAPNGRIQAACGLPRATHHQSGQAFTSFATPSSTDEINLGDTSAAYISCKCAWPAEYRRGGAVVLLCRGLRRMPAGRPRVLAVLAGASSAWLSRLGCAPLESTRALRSSEPAARLFALGGHCDHSDLER